MKRWINGEIALGFLVASFLWIAAVGWLTSYNPTQPEKEACYQAAAKTGHETSECKSFWERTTSDPVALFTLVLAFSTVGLWVATISLYFAGRSAVSETRRIGEAQVRAYVDIRAATVIFIQLTEGIVPLADVQPLVRVTAKNTGQSPARNFVWHPTVHYFSFSTPARNLYRRLGGNWREIAGIGIPVGEEHSGGALVTGMLLLRFLRESGPVVNALLLRVRIQFEYEDVFDRRVVDEAYFMGTAGRLPDIVQTDFGTTQWGCQLHRIDRPNDWPPEAEISG
jgi:hypothetical protein